jgi:hypothetical protein
MFFDKQAIFSENQAPILNGASAASTSVIDLGSKSSRVQSIVEYGLAKVFCQLTEAFDVVTSLKVDLQCDDNEAFSSPTTLKSQTILLAGLTVGAKFNDVMGVLPEGTERYIRLNFTTVGGPNTTGKIMAGLVLGVQTAGH